MLPLDNLLIHVKPIKLIKFTNSLLLLGTILLFILPVNTAIANQTDSLLLLIEQEKNNKRIVDLYNEIAHQYVDTFYTKALHYTSLSQDLAIAAEYPLGEAQSLYLRALSQGLQNTYQDALLSINKALKIIKEQSRAEQQQAQYLQLKGRIHFNLSDFVTAMALYNEAIELFDHLNDDQGKSLNHMNIAEIHIKLGNYDTSLEYLKRSRSIFEELGNTEALLLNLTITASVYVSKDNLDSSIFYKNRALQLTTLADETNLYRINSEILRSIADDEYSLKNYDVAITNYVAAQKIDRSLNDELAMAENDIGLARARYMLSQNISSIPIIKKAYFTARAYGDINIQILCAEFLSMVYKDQEKFDAALYFNETVIKLNDSILNNRIKEQVRALEINTQLAVKEKEFIQEKREALLETSIVYLLILLGLLILGGVLLYKAYRTTYNIKEELLIKNNSLKKAEERLALKNTDLQRYIDLNVELEQFAYIASHDIKAPLRTISSFIGILKKKFEDRAMEKEKGYFELVEKSAKSLNLLIDDLLGFSKSGSKTLKVTLVSLEPLLSEIIQNLDFSINQTNATIQLQNCDFQFHADQIKLKQILQNLLSNALKFKEDNRPPIINISAKEDTKFIYISIEDNGVGISEKHFDKVFQKFAQLNNKNKFEGSGLGLSIVSKYVKKHQGEIWIKQNEINGVTFTFTIDKSLSENKHAQNKSELLLTQK